MNMIKTLKPDDTIQVLLTRQHHEADVAGPHKDYRIVIGDKAYSFATKKMELPEPGGSIILWQQPVHDSKYATSKRVTIPSGNYGAGTTTLDYARKAELKQGKDYFTLTTKQGEKYLLKHLPKIKGGKGWLFKNLTKKEDEPVSDNKYLEKIATVLRMYQHGETGRTTWMPEGSRPGKGWGKTEKVKHVVMK